MRGILISPNRIEPPPHDYRQTLTEAIYCVGYCLLVIMVIIGQQTEYTYAFHTSVWLAIQICFSNLHLGLATVEVETWKRLKSLFIVVSHDCGTICIGCSSGLPLNYFKNAVSLPCLGGYAQQALEAVRRPTATSTLHDGLPGGIVLCSLKDCDLRAWD